jgi:hypothetical protein
MARRQYLFVCPLMFLNVFRAANQEVCHRRNTIPPDATQTRVRGVYLGAGRRAVHFSPPHHPPHQQQQRPAKHERRKRREREPGVLL